MIPPTIEYKRGDGGFVQSFLLNQNNLPYDLSKLAGTITVIWSFLENEPGAIKKTITWSGTYSGASNNRVSFAVPQAIGTPLVPFFNVATDYNSDIEVYNNEGVIFHTDPSFIVRINEVAGLHIDT